VTLQQADRSRCAPRTALGRHISAKFKLRKKLRGHGKLPSGLRCPAVELILYVFSRSRRTRKRFVRETTCSSLSAGCSIAKFVSLPLSRVTASKRRSSMITFRKTIVIFGPRYRFYHTPHNCQTKVKLIDTMSFLAVYCLLFGGNDVS
jgi:hypothetical protein